MNLTPIEKRKNDEEVGGAEMSRDVYGEWRGEGKVQGLWRTRIEQEREGEEMYAYGKVVESGFARVGSRGEEGTSYARCNARCNDRNRMGVRVWFYV